MSSGTIFAAFADGHVIALAPQDGSVRWDRRVAPPGQFLDVDSTPQLTGGRIFVAAFSGAVLALDGSSGKVEWEFKAPGASRLKLTSSGLIAVTTGRIYELAPENGTLLWEASLGGAPAGEPVLSRGRLLVPTVEGLLWLDARSGRPLRVFNPGSGVSATPAVRGTRAYVLSNSGVLFALDAT